MANVTITRNTTLPDSAQKSDFHNLVDTATATVGSIVNADIDGAAAIAPAKLAQITTAGKVSGTSLTGLASIPAGAGQIPTANLTFNYIKVSDTKAQNTNGGTFTSGAWQTRTINTEDTDTGGHCSIASNQITLAAGTYECEITCPGYSCNAHQARLRNITDNETTLVGSNEVSHGTSASSTNSIIQGRFTIATSKVFEIQHRCYTTQATNGFGAANNFGENEIYTVAVFRKVA